MPHARHHEVVTRDNYQCQAPFHDDTMTHRDCAGRLVVHHRKPKQMGGDRDASIHDMNNLILLCDHHHAYVHSHPARAYDTGLLIHR